MPYCPKCGIEVDDHVKRCPLCDFPIPDVTNGEIKKEARDNYPKAENIYKEELAKRKNSVFYFLFLLIATIVVVLTIVKAMYGYKLLDYFIVSFICIGFYMFFIFAYLRLWCNIIGISITTVVLTYFLSRLTQNASWFKEYALPITLLITADIFLNFYSYKLNRSKNKFVYIPVFIFNFITLLCIGVDFVIYYRVRGAFGISWSLIVASINIPIIFIMLIIYHKLPEKTVDILKKKFHI